MSLVLVDSAPPRLTLQDLDSGTWLDGEARFEVVALTPEGPRLRGSDGEPSGPPLADGAVVTLDARRWRLHHARPVVFTATGAVSLRAPSLAIDFDLSSLSARLSTRQGEVVLRGGLVRPLAVYAAAMTQGPRSSDGGWLCNADAQVGMGQLGVEMAAGPERMNWDRHRLRSALQELGVSDLDRLFERKRTGRQWVHRLGVRPQVSGLGPFLRGPTEGRP